MMQQTRKRSRLCPAAFFMMLLASIEVRAIDFYSIRLQDPAPTLVRIDSTTGAVTELADLPPMADVDLANVGLDLFAVNTEFGVQVNLFQLDPISGEVLSTAPVLLGGSQIFHAEGLAGGAGGLRIGFNPAAVTFSNRLGDLAPDGTITGDVFFCNPCDFDGLAEDADGTLFSLDVEPPVQETTFYQVDPAGTLNPVAGLDEDLGIFDLVVQGTDFWAIGGNRLLRIDRTTNTVAETVFLDGAFSGLAFSFLIFADGFESGDTSQWSARTP